MSYTKGTWRANGRRIECLEEFGISKVAMVEYRPDESWDANARLIAAAPDMLEALKWWDNFMEHNYSPSSMSAWNQTKQAIAKAEGK